MILNNAIDPVVNRGEDYGLERHFIGDLARCQMRVPRSSTLFCQLKQTVMNDVDVMSHSYRHDVIVISENDFE